MGKYSPYRNFKEESDALDFVEILKSHSIDFDLAIERTGLDTLYGENRFSTDYYIKLQRQDFEKVDAILLSLSERDLEKLPADYHLFTLTNEELKDILTHPDEWSEIDYLLAHKILDQRGILIDKDKLIVWRSTRLEKSTERKDDGMSLVYFGYCLSALGGILGILIGIHLILAKKKRNGNTKVFAYSAKERSHAPYIMLTGLIDFLFLAARIGYAI